MSQNKCIPITHVKVNYDRIELSTEGLIPNLKSAHDQAKLDNIDESNPFVKGLSEKNIMSSLHILDSFQKHYHNNESSTPLMKHNAVQRVIDYFNYVIRNVHLLCDRSFTKEELDNNVDMCIDQYRGIEVNLHRLVNDFTQYQLSLNVSVNEPTDSDAIFKQNLHTLKNNLVSNDSFEAIMYYKIPYTADQKKNIYTHNLIADTYMEIVADLSHMTYILSIDAHAGNYDYTSHSLIGYIEFVLQHLTNNSANQNQKEPFEFMIQELSKFSR